MDVEKKYILARPIFDFTLPPRRRKPRDGPAHATT
jgi:hypothetical protein